MARHPQDEEREHRIRMEIVVDAYHPEEHLQFPFPARCIAERSISPLQIGDEVEVTGMAPEDECDHEMFVMIRWERRGLAVPLALLDGIAVDQETKQALADWQYWSGRGYEFG